MKAIVLSRYGSPDVLATGEIPRPEPKNGEVLVKVHATAVNDWDWSLVRGKPYPYRLMFGLLRPGDGPTALRSLLQAISRRPRLRSGR